MMKNQPSVDFDDLLWGVPAIAEALQISKRRVQHLIDIGAIEVLRKGPKTLIASRTKLRQDFLPSKPTEKSETT